MSSSLLQHKDEKILFCVLVSGSLGSVAWTRKNFVLLLLMGVHIKQVKFRDNTRTFPIVCMGVCGPTIPLRGVSKIFWPPPLDFTFSPWDWQSASALTSHQHTWPQFCILLTNSTGKSLFVSDVLLRQMILYLVEMEALPQKGALTVMAVQLDPNVPLQNLHTTNSVQMVHIH